MQIANAVGAAVAPAANATTEAVKATAKAAGDATGIPALLAWLKGVFSVNTAARTAAIIIGIAFIIVALVAFILSTDAGKAVAKGAAAAAI